MKQSPKYRINYDPNGFDDLPEKYIEKRAAKIKRKYGEPAEQDFRSTMKLLSTLGDQIDNQWEIIVDKWKKCGIQPPISPSGIFIKIEEGTFTLPQYPELTEIWGTTDADKGKHVVNIRVASWAFIKKLGYSVNAIATIGWEIGNTFQGVLRGRPGVVSKEIGNGSPC